MSYKFTTEDIKSISAILESGAVEFDRGWSWRLNNKKSGQSLVITLYNEVSLGDDTLGSLLSIQTGHGDFEMHNCSAFLLFEPDEIIFVQAQEDVVSSLIIGKECTCSMFTNIKREILHSDFSKLDAPVLMSAMQLSLTENVLL